MLVPDGAGALKSVSAAYFGDRSALGQGHVRILESCWPPGSYHPEGTGRPVPCGRDHHVPLLDRLEAGSGAPPGPGQPALLPGLPDAVGVEEAHKVRESGGLDERICRARRSGDGTWPAGAWKICRNRNGTP